MIKKLGIILLLLAVFVGLSGIASATTEPTFKSYYNTKNPKVGKLVYSSELTYYFKNGYNKKIIHSYVTKITKTRLYLKTYETVIIKRGNKTTKTVKIYFEEEMR